MINVLHSLGWALLAYLGTYIAYGVVTYLIFRKIEKITASSARSVGYIAALIAFLLTL